MSMPNSSPSPARFLPASANAAHPSNGAARCIPPSAASGKVTFAP